MLNFLVLVIKATDPNYFQLIILFKYSLYYLRISDNLEFRDFRDFLGNSSGSFNNLSSLIHITIVTSILESNPSTSNGSMSSTTSMSRSTVNTTRPSSAREERTASKFSIFEKNNRNTLRSKSILMRINRN